MAALGRSPALNPVRIAVKLALVLATAVLLVAAPARAVTAPEAIAFLNEQRAAAGLPSNLAENISLDEGCALHLAYLEANANEPGVSKHEEYAEKPGYTTLGAEAGGRSDLWFGGGVTATSHWSATENPWLSATSYAVFHFAQLFDPAATEAWYAEDGHAACMGTNWFVGFGGQYPATPRLYSYPGNGQTGVPVAVENFELPITPAEIAGLTGPTGPNLVYYFLSTATTAVNRQPTVTAATLTGPDGPVATKLLTPTTPMPGGIPLSAAVPGAAFLIPVAPLAGEHDVHRDDHVGKPGRVVPTDHNLHDREPRNPAQASRNAPVWWRCPRSRAPRSRTAHHIHAPRPLGRIYEPSADHGHDYAPTVRHASRHESRASAWARLDPSPARRTLRSVLRTGGHEQIRRREGMRESCLAQPARPPHHSRHAQPPRPRCRVERPPRFAPRACDAARPLRRTPAQAPRTAFLYPRCRRYSRAHDHPARPRPGCRGHVWRWGANERGGAHDSPPRRRLPLRRRDRDARDRRGEEVSGDVGGTGPGP
jgi:hypothetical protein